MPSRGRDRAKPTYYLDHSTLCDAFRAHALGGTTASPAAYKPLMAWIERVATEANLCLSIFHIAELGRWRDIATANAMARWYEKLPIVWVRSMTDVQDREDEHWTKVAASVKPCEQLTPFAPSLLAAFQRLDGDALSELLAKREPVVALLEAIRTKGQGKEVASVLRIAQAFRDDRARAETLGWSADRRREETAYKRRVDLRKRATAADQRLVARGDLEYAATECSGGDVQDLFVKLFDDNPASLPCFRAVQRFNAGLIAFALKKQGGSKSERDALSGSFHDLIHVSVGAAYCDVFTCDGIVSDWLGDLRDAIGLSRQLSVGRTDSGAKGFVEALMATWPRLDTMANAQSKRANAPHVEGADA